MRFIQVHALVNVLSLVNASSGGIHVHLALVSAALLGVGQWGGFSSHIFYTQPLARLESDHWGFFCINLITLLHSWWFPFYLIFPTFPEAAPKLSEDFLSLTISARAADIFLLPDLIGSLRYCRQVADIHSIFWQNSIQALSPLFSLISGGYPKFSGVLLRSREWCLWKSSPCHLFMLSLHEEVFGGLLSFSLTVFWR